MPDEQPNDDAPRVDPVEFLRAALNISPGDAAEVRDEAADNMRRCRSVHGSNHRCELSAGHGLVHEARIDSRPGDPLVWTDNGT